MKIRQISIITGQKKEIALSYEFQEESTFEEIKIVNSEEFLIQDNYLKNHVNNNISNQNTISFKKTSRFNRMPLEIIKEMNQEFSISSPKKPNEIENRGSFQINLKKLDENIEEELEMKETIENTDRINFNSMIITKKKTYEIPKENNQIKLKVFHKSVDLPRQMDPWKSICIHNIICAEKINSLTKTEILFKGELFKCSKEDLLTNIAEINYFTKFCLMMKNKFMCFKSKSSLFSLQDPLFKIKLSDVIEIDFINKNKSKYLNLNQDFYHFYIKASNNKRDKSISTNYSSNILNPTYTETRALCRSSSSTFKKEEHKAKKREENVFDKQ